MNTRSEQGTMTADDHQRIRLFVAIQIPEAVRNEMIALQQELKSLALGDVRWANPQQLHLSLKFLGNVPVASLEAVKKSLTGACAGTGPFLLRAQGIGFFPNERQPRVIWVGFEAGDNALARLQWRVEQSLALFAEKPGAEKFLPHATLGRFQKYRRYKTEQLVPRALAHQHRVFGEWRAEEAVLFRSELSPEGARHSPVAVFPFGATFGH